MGQGGGTGDDVHDDILTAIDDKLITAREKLDHVEALLREQGALRAEIARLTTARRALAGAPVRERKPPDQKAEDNGLADRLVAALTHEALGEGAWYKVKTLLDELDCSREALRQARRVLGARVESPKRGWWRLVPEVAPVMDGADTHA